jgi:serine/threonine protein kinase
MQCGECGLALASNVQSCPACGAKQPIIQHPSSSAPQGFSPPIFGAKPAGAVAKPVKPVVSSAVAVPAKSGLPQPGEMYAQRYRIEKYLGLGSLCNAYLCRDSSAGNREVVLKIMHARKAAEAGMPESFVFLAESVSRYDHKGIAKVLGSGRHEGAAYYTMDWIPGTPLRLWLMERLNFENRVLPGLGIIRALLEIFEVIHERGCYGCLKPENVFITLNGPVVMDFGVVGFLSPQEFEFNSYARRYIPYMAPELRQDWSNLLPHSDYYSLGALLYEILVGRAPAPQLRLPSELSRIFGIEADEIILKSMAGRPLDRFGTLEAFRHAVESLQATLLNARPPEGMEGLPPAQVSSGIHSHLDLTSDVQSVHNPDMTFSSPQLQQPHVQAEPWSREPISGQASEAPDPVSRMPRHTSETAGHDDGDSDPGARTVFYPNPAPEANPAHEEGERTLSSFANLGDRISEEAHSQRRFTRAPVTPLPESVPEAGAVVSDSVHSAKAWDGLADKPVSEDASWSEPEAESVPAWLWVVIALAGIGLVGVSAYFGMMMPR